MSSPSQSDNNEQSEKHSSTIEVKTTQSSEKTTTVNMMEIVENIEAANEEEQTVTNDDSEDEEEESLHSWSDTEAQESRQLAEEEEIMIIDGDEASKPGDHGQLHRYRFSSQKSLEEAENSQQSDQPQGNSRRSTSMPSLLVQQLLSTLLRPFKSKSKKIRTRRNRRTQTDTIAGSTVTTAKSKSRLRLAKSFVSTSSSASGCKLLLRRLRVPLAITCFVFFFVIQFRANQPSIVQSSQPAAAAPLYLAASPSVQSNLSSATEQSAPSPSANEVLINRDLQAVPTVKTELPEITSIPVNTTSLQSNTTKPPCPLIPAKLVGRLKVLREPPEMHRLEELLSEVQVGGHFSPPDCTPKFKVAIIVPYRNREKHLRTFLYNIHPMLMRQNIEYGIFIVEQSGNDRFNRAKLMNVGFLEARNHYDYDCFIFHDVDLIPEDDRNLYTCPEQPRHMSVAIDKFRYRLPYKDLFGGVSALTREQFETVNGFSNEFWGWGGEDDDMSNRVRHHKYKITRYKPDIARYTMLKHEQDAPNADRYKKLYNGWRRFASDGISSTKYAVLDTDYKKLYTWILVDVFPPPMAKKKSRRHLDHPYIHRRHFGA